MSSNLNERQQLAVVLLCSGLSATEVAKELKVRKETISRWKNDRDFNEELRNWRLAFFDRLIKRQFALFSEAQHQIEAAFQDSALTSYQKANIALRFISMFSGNMNVNKQLASKKSDLYFKDDKLCVIAVNINWSLVELIQSIKAYHFNNNKK